jgi:hypothetical protein
MTSSELEFMTLRLAEQCLNHLRYRGPLIRVVSVIKQDEIIHPISYHIIIAGIELDKTELIM